MRLVSFVHDGRTDCGVLEGERILVDPESRQADLKTVLEQNALSGFAEACAASGKRLPLDGIMLLPVIPNPGKILCVGHNYEEHRQETGREGAPRQEPRPQWTALRSDAGRLGQVAGAESTAPRGCVAA